jgi:hypothetical protein
MRAATGERSTPTRGALAFVIGFVCGWAARSTVDSPHALGMKAFVIAHDAKVRVSRWLAMEQERMSDILAEARARYNAPFAEVAIEPAVNAESDRTARVSE